MSPCNHSCSVWIEELVELVDLILRMAHVHGSLHQGEEFIEVDALVSPDLLKVADSLQDADDKRLFRVVLVIVLDFVKYFEV